MITAFPKISKSAKTGNFYLAIRGTNGCSICYTPTWGFTPYGKGSTKGARNVADAFFAALPEHRKDGVAEFTAEPVAEERIALNGLGDGWRLVLADAATVFGVAVSSDGAYLVNPKGEIFELNYWD